MLAIYCQKLPSGNFGNIFLIFLVTPVVFALICCLFLNFVGISQQEDIEESARAELWREELIEEIEQKVGGLRELEEAGKKEELVK